MVDEDLKSGQKYPTPTPGFGDRVFYETLLKQRPDSEIAQEWCVAYGVLPHDEAERLNKIVSERKKHKRLNGGTASPMKSPAKKKKKTKIVKDEAINPDMQVSGGDGIGTAIL